MNTGLLIIDVQKGFDDPLWGKRNNPDAEVNIQKLLIAFREARKPIYHVKHNSINPASPLRPNQAGNDFKELVKPLRGEPIFEKQVNSAFIGTLLEAKLRMDDIKQLVVTGLTTDHCVSTTIRMAANLGFKVHVPFDATATFGRISYTGKYYSAEEMHESALTSLRGEFATVLPSSEVIRLLNSSTS